MKYLFFDIECANCCNGSGKICEFGYVLTDDNFGELEKKLFIINPQDGFDWFVLKNMLAFKKEVYQSSPDYKKYFNKIKALFEDVDTMFFGHTVDADFTYLNDEAKRFGLPFFNCKFYDIKYMYNTYKNKPVNLGVGGICEEMGIPLPKHEHKSVDDAYATMMIAKELCKRQSASIMELIEGCPDCVGQTADGNITTPPRERARLAREQRERERAEKGEDNLVRGDNKIRLLQFLDGVSAQGEAKECEFTGKKLSVSLNYEYGHFKEILALVQLLKNVGCEYGLKASEADYFVTYLCKNEDGTDRVCSRYNYVKEAIEKGKKISVITFEQLLAALGTTESALSEMPIPDESTFVKKTKLKKKIESKSTKIVYADETSPTTIGDLIRLKKN